MMWPHSIINKVTSFTASMKWPIYLIQWSDPFHSIIIEMTLFILPSMQLLLFNIHSSPPGQIVTISQTTFTNDFMERKNMYFWIKFTEVCS